MDRTDYASRRNWPVMDDCLTCHQDRDAPFDCETAILRWKSSGLSLTGRTGCTNTNNTSVPSTCRAQSATRTPGVRIVTRAHY
jgi:hypothetical protein